MNPDAPLTPRDEREIRLTALLMGELSAEEAAEVQAQMAADPELAALHARLRQASELLREASALPEPVVPALARFSSERRERLLAHFKTAPPPPRVVVPTKKRDWQWAVPLALAAMLIVVIGGSMLVAPLSVTSLRREAPDFTASDGSLVAGESVDVALPTPEPAQTFTPATPQMSTPTLATASTTNMSPSTFQIAGSAPALPPVEPYAISKAWPTEGRVWMKGSGAESPPVTLAKSGSGTFSLGTSSAVSDAPSSAPEAPAAPSPTAHSFMKRAPSATPAPMAAGRAVGGKQLESAGMTSPSGSAGGRGYAFNGGTEITAGSTFAIAGGVTGPATAGQPVPAPPEENSNLNLFSAAMPAEPQLRAKADTIDPSDHPSAPEPMPTPSIITPRITSGTELSNRSSTTARGGIIEADGFLNTDEAKPLAWFGDTDRSAGGAGDKAAAKFKTAGGFVDAKDAVNGRTKNQLGVNEVAEAPMLAPDASTYYSRSISPELRGQVEEAKKKVADAENFYESGRYDLALKRTEQALNQDPFNTAARNVQEKVNKAIDDYGAVAYEETRSRAVRNLDTAWANPTRRFNQPTSAIVEQTKSEISRTDLITRKLERMIIPKLEFKEATVREALEFLREKSRAMDTTEPNPANRGVNMVLKLNDQNGAPATESVPAAPAIPGLEALPGAAPVTSVPAAANPADARITVSLSNIPLSEAIRYVTNLAGLKYKVEPHAISIVPASADTDTVITREFKVRPDLIGRGLETGAVDATRGGSGHISREAAKDWLIANGMTFGPQASAIYIPSSGKLIVRNTEEELNLIESIVASSESVEEPKKAPEQDAAAQNPKPDALVPQPEVQTSANAFSTFSLNVSDVAFKLAAASLEQGKMPEPGTMRSEEFINAFDYRDPEPAAGAPLAFATERARYPFAQNRDLLRLSVKTAAAGRQPGRALNLVLLLDNSGSMERADRVRILQEALRVLSAQLQPQDKLSVVTFARTPRLWADGVAGDQASVTCARVSEITPQGGTNIDAALDLGYATALRHYQPGSINRVVLLTDGAANLGDVHPDALKKKVESYRQQGVALDCFGIGWEGFNDDLLEQLSRNGDGRYGFINSPEEAATEFAGQLAGALRVAASDVKVQVEFNPRRVTAYRQVGYAKHQLTKEQFRDNTVDAAEIGAAESGNALYVVEVNPRGEGDLATVRVRFKVPGTSDYREHEWAVPFTPNAPPLEQASPALRLAGTAAAFSEMLAASPYAAEVTSDRLLALLTGVPAIYGADPRPQKLEWMIRQAKSVSGR